MRQKWTLLTVLLLAATAGFAWTPEEQLKVKGVGDVRVSPDGRRVVFTVTEQVMETEKSERRTHIWLARADGSDSFQLTRGEKSCTNPRWSPDGKWIAFTSERSDKNNIWLIRADGGEAEQLTDLKSGLGSFRWSNSGRWIAFTAPSDMSEEDEKKEKEKRDWKVLDTDFKFHRLWTLALEKDAEGKRTPRQLTLQHFHVEGEFDGSPDDWKIAFEHTLTPRVNDWLKADVSEVEVASGIVRPLTNSEAAEFSPLYSPDGRWIAYIASDIPPTWASDERVHVIPAAGGVPRTLAETFDRRPSLVGWTADSNALIVQESRGTSPALYRLPLNGAPVTLYTPQEGTFSAVSLNRGRNMLGFVAQTNMTAPEAFVAPVQSPTPVQVSRANADLPQLPLGRTEVIRWNGPDELEIEGLLTYPVEYQEGRRYPLLLVIHGGPTGVFRQFFIASSTGYPLATFATRGYAILRPNPRGSSGYGKDFRYANYGDWGGGDYQDLMAGVDHVIALGVADPDRMGVMGWSYGGYMTSWIITQTKRFKAASVGAGITNLFSMTGTSDIPGFIPDYFGGEAWDRTEAYLKHSAMFHMKGVSTPTLIQHGERDERVPLSQGLELYNALVRQGVPTRMVVYPRTPHGPREPKFLQHLMQDNLDWFDKYLKGSP